MDSMNGLLLILLFFGKIGFWWKIRPGGPIWANRGRGVVVTHYSLKVLKRVKNHQKLAKASIYCSQSHNIKREGRKITIARSKHSGLTNFLGNSHFWTIFQKYGPNPDLWRPIL